jgi:hypothetical protein
MRYELWEVSEGDGCVQPLALIGTFTDMFSATAAAVQCRRPGVEVKMFHDGPIPFTWLSHTVDRAGRWLRAFGPRNA